MTRHGLSLSFALFVAATSVAAAQELPRLQTNEAYITKVTKHDQTLNVGDPMAVFGYVFGSLPDRVKVYPTENPYYFAFDLNGIRYAGNIKIDAFLRAQGKVEFSYYEDRGPWLADSNATGLALDASRGVAVEQIDPLTYKLTYRNKSVTFALNDLSKVKPPPSALAAGDQFIGPVFDDSGVRFFLVFNRNLKLFLYILDETVTPADIFVPTPVGHGRILIGKRTGFAVYRDQQHDRKILIGVFHDNVAANNYLDGPFDQMPDNFIVGDSFRDAILAIAPDLKGKINRYGSFDDGARFAIAPYMEYRNPRELAVFDRCATDRRIPPAQHEACFALPLDSRHDARTRPLVMPRYPR